MRLPQSLSRAFVFNLLFTLGFGVVAILVGDKNINAFDASVTRYIQGKESVEWTRVMKIFTDIGSGVPVVIITIISMTFIHYILHHRRELVLFITVLVGSEILNVVLKAIFHRERPTVHRLISESGFGFPSGHSMGAFSLYGALVFLLWKHIPVLWGRTLLILISVTLILAIGISRIYLGVHYPSDVFAGYLASGFWLMTSISVYQRFMERFHH
ncbi:phosphatase PAP2 family protein [Paenibacillus solisilvae]|uniref:Phosphatase PAP2 family protein n=1 Tax=Paenibacillus solisilvae TaxID=2486751 RepID=A0ABW0VSG2_9BACL